MVIMIPSVWHLVIDQFQQWIKVAEFKARVNGVICLPKKLSEIQDLMNKVLFQGYIQHSALAYNWKSPLILSALLLQREQHDINFPSITN